MLFLTEPSMAGDTVQHYQSCSGKKGCSSEWIAMKKHSNAPKLRLKILPPALFSSMTITEIWIRRLRRTVLNTQTRSCLISDSQAISSKVQDEDSHFKKTNHC